jgi:hypothetical protein
VDPDGDAVTYQVLYTTASNFSVFDSSTGLAASQFTPASALTDNTRYYWLVVSQDPGNPAVSTGPFSFTVNTDQDPPSVPSGMSPVNATLSTTSVTFDWDDATDPDPDDTFTYTVHFSTLSDFSVLTSSFNMVLSQHAPAGGLLDNKVYYWRVVTQDRFGIIVPGPVESFTVNAGNDAPSAPALWDPVGSTTANTTPLFDWTDAVDLDPGDSVSYEIRYTTDVTFGVYSSSAGLPASQFTPATPLTPANTYYWVVVASDLHGASTLSNTSGFILVSGAVAPAPAAERAKAYPNPYRPGRGDPNTGLPYDGRPGSGITFFDLPEGSTVDLYTVTGELVKRLEAGGATSAQWDVRNQSNQDVSTGGYIAVIRAPGGGKSVRKVLVIR